MWHCNYDDLTERDQYHNIHLPFVLSRYHSSSGIAYVRYIDPCYLQGKISTTYTILFSEDDKKVMLVSLYR